ncbi:serine/threonine protein kinase [Coleofasciculus sp.]|uniref:serine/threonine protein kinase n=1 Tax=Coleofasciculus sp. TaxID=3100458 RepID=UPI0039FA60BD
MTWSSGQKLHGNNYILEKELKRGQFSVTYLASDRKKNQWVIKTLSDQLIHDFSQPEVDQIQETFLCEAVKLVKCRHPNLVQVKEPLVEGHQVGMVMEYLDGVDLARHGQKGLPESEALLYIQQIGEALKVIHEAGLIHRDVKPSNIRLRTGQSEAVLIDFGLARECNDASTTVDTHTADGFDALELYNVETPLGAYTDVYSLAATLYFLVTGEIPPTAMDRCLSKARLIPPKQINEQISDRTNEVILIGMALQVDERPQTIQEWLDLLGLQRQIPGAKRQKSPLIWIAAIAAVVGVLGLIAAWFLFKPASIPQQPTPVQTPVSSVIHTPVSSVYPMTFWSNV